jgi:hypothetical protein
MKRAWQNFATQMDHYKVSSLSDCASQAGIEYRWKLTIIMR